MRWGAPVGVAVLVGGGALATATDAAAYCRTTTCNDGAECLPAKASDCGTPLSWPSKCVGYSMQKDGSAEIPFDVASAAMRGAFDAWMAADCGNGVTPGLVVFTQENVSCDVQQYNPDAGNANIIMFRDAEWPYGGNNTLALTTVTFNIDTGQIRDVDMEINTAQVDFSFDTDATDFDLQSVMTHEAGHFLGIAHSDVEYATMYSKYSPRSISLRTPSRDDMAAICAVFPPGEITDAECKPDPLGGLESGCTDYPEEDDGGCSVAAAGSAPAGSSPLGWGTLAFGLATLARGRRRPRA